MNRYKTKANKLFDRFRKKVNSSSPLKIESAYIEKIKAASGLYVFNSEIEEIKVSGECVIEQSYIHHIIANQKIRLLDEVNIGTLIAMSEVEAEGCLIKVFRNCNSRGNSESKTNKVKGEIVAITYENYTSSVLDYDFHYTNILNKYFLECEKAIECHYFISFAPFYIPKIKADVMFIRPYFNTFVEVLEANTLWIENKLHNKDLMDEIPSICDFRELVNKQFETSKMRVEKIKAKDLVIENCDAMLIQVENIVVKENCQIERLEVSGTYEIHKSSHVVQLYVGGVQV